MGQPWFPPFTVKYLIFSYILPCAVQSGQWNCTIEGSTSATQTIGIVVSSGHTGGSLRSEEQIKVRSYLPSPSVGYGGKA